MPSILLSDNGVSSGSAGLKQIAASDGSLALQTTTGAGTATTAVTIDTSQNVGVGTTSPSQKLHVEASTTATIRLVATGTQTSHITSDASGFTLNSLSANPVIFSTSNTERARINTSAEFLVGTTGGITNGGFALAPNNSGAGNSGFFIGHINGSATGSFYCGFGYNGTFIGSITQSGTTAVLYNVTSDQRLKENIADADSASSLIDSLQVRKFDWKTDNTHQRYGFVAQELVTVAPEAVHQPTNPNDMMAVDYSKLVPMLVKEIQSLRARVASLESN